MNTRIHVGPPVEAPDYRSGYLFELEEFCEGFSNITPFFISEDNPFLTAFCSDLASIFQTADSMFYIWTEGNEDLNPSIMQYVDNSQHIILKWPDERSLDSYDLYYFDGQGVKHKAYIESV